MNSSGKAYETYRSDFIKMSEALSNCQREDGFWNANLGDNQHLAGRETSGTCGFWFGLCTGIELGILDREVYQPVADKIYAGISQYAVNKDGMLGYCQPVGSSPAAAKQSDTNMFGVGLYLMGASAYMRICEDYSEKALVTSELSELEDKYASLKNSDRPWMLEKGYLSASDIESAKSTAKPDYPENTAANLFNGKYRYETKGASWVGGGLNSSPVVADIALKNAVAVQMLALTARDARPYKMKIELSADGVNYVTVADTTKEKISGAWLYKFSFDPVNNVKYIRLTVTGIWADAISWATINELFIYPYK